MKRKTVAIAFCLRVPSHWKVVTIERLMKDLIYNLEEKREDPITKAHSLLEFVTLHKDRVEVFNT